MVLLLAFLLIVVPLFQPGPSFSDLTIELALLESTWDQSEFSQSVLQTMRRSLASSERVSLLDPPLVQSAVKGFGYDGSLNLTLDQARNLGSALGCDYYILGRGRLVPRSLGADQVAYRAWVALFMVDARNGKLAKFEFLQHERPTPTEASISLLTELQSKVPLDLDQASQQPDEPASRLKTTPSIVIEIDDPTKPPPAGAVQPPRILISPKPGYTSQAQLADVSATVELKVTFLGDGTIGLIEVVRWAGFGLDESAIDAAQKIRFRPATLKGQPVAARALVRYKFQLKDRLPQHPLSEIEPTLPGHQMQLKESHAVESVERLDRGLPPSYNVHLGAQSKKQGMGDEARYAVGLGLCFTG